MAWYIQRRHAGVVETIDEIDDRSEAHRLANEHNLSDKTAYHYVAKNPCKSWLRQSQTHIKATQ